MQEDVKIDKGKVGQVQEKENKKVKEKEVVISQDNGKLLEDIKGYFTNYIEKEGKGYKVEMHKDDLLDAYVFFLYEDSSDVLNSILSIDFRVTEEGNFDRFYIDKVGLRENEKLNKVFDDIMLMVVDNYKIGKKEDLLNAVDQIRKGTKGMLEFPTKIEGNNKLVTLSKVPYSEKNTEKIYFMVADIPSGNTK